MSCTFHSAQRTQIKNLFFSSAYLKRRSVLLNGRLLFFLFQSQLSLNPLLIVPDLENLLQADLVRFTMERRLQTFRSKFSLEQCRHSHSSRARSDKVCRRGLTYALTLNIFLPIQDSLEQDFRARVTGARVTLARFTLARVTQQESLDQESP